MWVIIIFSKFFIAGTNNKKKSNNAEHKEITGMFIFCGIASN